MKKRLKTIISICLAAVPYACTAVGCTAEIQDYTNTDSSNTFLSFEVATDCSQAKTSLNSAKEVMWSEGDAISILDGSANNKFITSDSGRWATFAGSAKSGVATYYVVYPYTVQTHLTGSAVNFTLPKSQLAVKGSFADGSNVAMGKTSGKTVEMKNALGLVSFVITTDNIASVSLKGNNGEALWGNATIGMASDYPSVSISGGGPTLSLSKEEGAFEPGLYYMCVPPTVFDSGIELVFRNTENDKIAFRSSSNPCRVDRSRILSLGIVDNNLEWVENGFSIDLVFISEPEGTVFNWPFASPSSADLSTKAASPSYINTPATFTLPASMGGYEFVLTAVGGCAKNAGSSQGLKYSGKGSTFRFPKIDGMTLTSVYCRFGGSGDMSQPRISCVEDGSIPTGGNVMGSSSSGKGFDYTWDLAGTTSSHTYQLESTSSGGIYIQELKLTYCALSVSDTYISVSGNDDAIPDFSRVGYHWGEDELPTYPVVQTLYAPSDGSDATQMIQNAINNFANGQKGAILLKAGTYNISSHITLNKSGLVLRGEGTSTILYGTGTTQRDMIEFGNSNSMTVVESSKSKITDQRTPVGQMFLRVENPQFFKAGDRVAIYRPGTANWIHDLHMDDIAQNSDKSVVQWTPTAYSIYWERTVMKVEENRVWLDNPVVMEMTDEYGGGYLYKCSWSRISESGIEDLCIDTQYNGSTDENHIWSGIDVHSAEHCWISGITTRHMGYCCVCLSTGSKNITAQNLASLSPISVVTGSRRYAFHHAGSQMSIFKNCHCESDRHGCVTGSRVPGPNVFLRCDGTNMKSDMGPHQRWATGVLYDNVITSGDLFLQDRDGYGTGHGWTSANFVLWNCKANRLVVQSPWVSAKNYAYGCIGQHLKAGRSYARYGTRPEGEWISEGVRMEDESLYEKQLKERLERGEYISR